MPAVVYCGNIYFMIDNAAVIDAFVCNFIQKDKRERSHGQLMGKNRMKFTDFLNHKWDSVLNMNVLQELKKNDGDYERVRQLLGMRDADMCYIIADEKCDNTFAPFKEAFEIVDSASFGALLIDMTGNKLFLKTESMGGHTPRFVGVVR